MSQMDLEQQLRNEMHHKFKIELKSKGKKRKSSFNDRPSNLKKQKLSYSKKATTLKSKASMIEELKSLGLVQGSKISDTASLLQHRRSFPVKNDNWKQKNKPKQVSKTHQPQRNTKQHTAKPETQTKFNKLHDDINIYNLRGHLWYNLYDIISKDNACGHKIRKDELFLMSNSQIFMLTETLYQELSSRDRIRNEFHSFALCSGTFRDRISTMIFRLEQLSLTRMNHLDSILDVLSRDTKRQSVNMIPSLISLFINTLLPQRHLLTFNDSLKLKTSDDDEYISQMQLILFYFEHLLKKGYLEFVELLSFYCTNNEISKLQYESSVGLYKLLMNKSENEGIILNLLINKFGENDKDFTLRITQYLIKIAQKHPLMKPDIIREINNYLKRASLSPRGLYRAVFFLSKLRFCSLENEAATLLCGIYMDLFKQLMGYQNVFDAMNPNQTQTESQTPNKTETETNNKQISIMKKLNLMSRKKRNLLFKKHKKELAIWKRFVLLKEITPKLLSLILKGISYVFPLANLNLKIFRDDLDYIYKLILKSNMKIALMALQFTFRVESIAEIAVSGTNITDKTPRQIIKYGKDRKREMTATHNRVTPSDRFYQILYALCCRWDFVIYAHPQIVFNLMFCAIKCDSNKVRIAAFMRRLIQFCCYGTTEWICGCLYLWSAVLSIHPFLSDLFNNNLNENGYDLNQNDPKVSNATQCPLWELTVLCAHVHPAVQDFAKQLLNKKHILYNGDPLKDFKRKVLFEKFTRIMAHKMKEFKPNVRKNKAKNKAKLIESYVVGDGFIAIYKEHYENKNRNKRYEDEEQEDVVCDDELDQDNASDELMADKAMFTWLKSHYGTEIPDDDAFDDDDYYDYTELKQEIEQQRMGGNRKANEEEEVSDVDVYLSDIDRENDDEDGVEEEYDDDEQEEEETTQKPKVTIENEMLFNEIENEDIKLPSDVEYASNDEISDNLDDENQEEEEDDDEDLADFFDEEGVGAEEFKV